MRILCVLLLLAAVATCDRWDISRAVTSVPYGDGRIPVWHDANTDTYLVMPLVMLINDSAKIQENVFTNKTELNFGVLMWTVEAQELVYHHLKANVNSNVSEHQIQVLPIEKLRLIWQERDRPSNDYRLVNNWRSNVHLPSVIHFQILCTNRERCSALKEAMKSGPGIFHGLELQYLVSSPKRQVVTITGRHLSSGVLYPKLAAMRVHSNLRYVTSEDADVIASEAVLAALSATVPDYVDTGEVDILTNAMKRKVKLHPVSSASFLPENWEKVFWEPESSRPDKLSQYLNSAFRPDPNDTTSFLVDDRPLPEFRACANQLRIGNGTKINSSVRKMPKQTVLDAVKDRMEWDGDHFVARPVILYRLDLRTLNSSENLLWTDVSVRSQGSVQRVKVRVRNAKQPSRLTLELIQARLQSDITVVRGEQRILKLETSQAINRTVAETLPGIVDTNVNTKLPVLVYRTLTTSLPGIVNGSVDTRLTGIVQREIRPELMNLTNAALYQKLEALANMFNNWPEYCHLPDHYCVTSWKYAQPSSGNTIANCKRECDRSDRCEAFSYIGEWSSTTRCLLYHHVCPGGMITSNSANDYFVKLSRVPIMTTQMWKSLLMSGTVGDVPSDPCQMIGEKYTYSRHP